MKKFRFYKNKTKLALRLFAAAALMTSSCQKINSNSANQKKRENFARLLEQGRVVNHTSSVAKSRGFFAVGDPVVAMKQDSFSGAISFVSYDTTKMPGLLRSDLVAASLSFLQDKTSEFKLSSAQLELIKKDGITLPNNIVVYSFYRVVNKLRVRDGYIDFVYSLDSQNKYHLREVVNRVGGEIVLVNEGQTSAVFADVVTQTGFSELELVEKKDLILKMNQKSTIQYAKVTQFTAKNKKTNEIINFSVEAGSNKIHEAYSNRVYAKKHKFVGQVLDKNYLDAKKIDSPMAFSTVTGTDTNIQLNADGEGDIGDNETLVTVDLQSNRVRIVDYSDQDNTVKIPVNITGDKATLEGSGLASVAVNMFTSTHRINRFVRRHYKDTDTRYLSDSITVFVNRDTEPDRGGGIGEIPFSCNAFYDGSISLAKEGNQGNFSCANMGLINDVLYHEWGHGLDNFTGRTGGITDGAFSEGIGDIVASYYVNSPNMASGFFLNEKQGIRQLDNKRVYPDDGPGRGADREVHDEGRIIGGAFWHLREALIKRYGYIAGSYKAEQLFYNHLLIADAYLESYEIVMRLDDGDGNPATPSPNFCLINEAFSRHGLAELETDCTDAPQQADAPPFDKTMFLGISSEDAKGALLMISAEKDTARVHVCLDEWKKCLDQNRIDIKFVSAGQAGERDIFLAENPVRLKEFDIMTLVARDLYGNILSVNSMKYSKK